jgi:hypothetical protein
MKRIATTATFAILVLALAGVGAAKGNYVHRLGTIGLPRAAHTATMLDNHDVLLAGGMQADGVSTAETRIFDAIRWTFRDGPAMTVARAGHTATVLDDRRILLLGGYDGRTPVSTAEVFVPSSNSFVNLGEAPVSGGGFTATRLNDGRVLIVGAGGAPGTKAILFDPETDTFSEAGSLSVARTGHTATLLDDGRVLIAGGSDGTDVIASSELFDPGSNSFAAAGAMSAARHKHAAVKLVDGSVLVMGGATAEDWESRLTSAEVFDPATGQYTTTGSLLTPRFKFGDAVTLLNDGNVLVAGGGVPEIYDVEAGSFAHLPGEQRQALHYATASKLRDGQVIIVGGYTQSITVTDDAYLYAPPHVDM